MISISLPGRSKPSAKLPLDTLNTFLIIDKIYNKIITNETSVSSGSLALPLEE
jgi:hypothetical protein